MMLNSDMSLYRDIQIADAAAGAVSSACSSMTTDSLASSCSPASTAPIVELFAANNTAFVDAFLSAWDKLLALGAPESSLEPPDSPSPTSAPTAPTRKPTGPTRAPATSRPSKAPATGRPTATKPPKPGRG